MKQAQEFQEKMKTLQDQIALKTFEGVSGAGLVQARINGTGMIESLTLDDTLIVLEDKAILIDLIIAAINEAKSKMDRESQSEMAELSKGFKLPF